MKPLCILSTPDSDHRLVVCRHCEFVSLTQDTLSASWPFYHFLGLLGSTAVNESLKDVHSGAANAFISSSSEEEL